MKTLLAAVLLLPLGAMAQLKVEDAWIRATGTGLTATSAFMRILPSQTYRLVEVHSSIGDGASLQQGSVDRKGITTLRPVSEIQLPANGIVELRPNGYQIRITGLRRPLNVGDSVTLSLVVDGRGGRQSYNVQVPVLPQPKGS